MICRVNLQRLAVLHPLLSFDLCKLLDVPALEDVVEEVSETTVSMTEIESIQVLHALPPNACQ